MTNLQRILKLTFVFTMLLLLIESPFLAKASIYEVDETQLEPMDVIIPERTILADNSRVFQIIVRNTNPSKPIVYWRVNIESFAHNMTFKSSLSDNNESFTYVQSIYLNISYNLSRTFEVFVAGTLQNEFSQSYGAPWLESAIGRFKIYLVEGHYTNNLWIQDTIIEEENHWFWIIKNWNSVQDVGIRKGYIKSPEICTFLITPSPDGTTGTLTWNITNTDNYPKYFFLDYGQKSMAFTELIDVENSTSVLNKAYTDYHFQLEENESKIITWRYSLRLLDGFLWEMIPIEIILHVDSVEIADNHIGNQKIISFIGQVETSSFSGSSSTDIVNFGEIGVYSENDPNSVRVLIETHEINWNLGIPMITILSEAGLTTISRDSISFTSTTLEFIAAKSYLWKDNVAKVSDILVFIYHEADELFYLYFLRLSSTSLNDSTTGPMNGSGFEYLLSFLVVLGLVIKKRKSH